MAIDPGQCNMCSRRMTDDENCGGDCIYCMAFFVLDPDCIRKLHTRLTELLDPENEQEPMT